MIGTDTSMNDSIPQPKRRLPIAFAAYRLSDSDPEHVAALRQALLSGVETIDTSPLYNDAFSERVVGQVLSEIERAPLQIVAKAGFLIGERLATAFERGRSGKAYADTYKLKEECWYCI